MDKNQNNQSISEKADQLLDSYQVHAKMNKKVVLDTILKKIEQKEETPVRKINWYSVAGISAAASIAVLVVVYFFTASVNVSSEKGEIYTYRMADDSRIVLHEESSVKFGKYFNKRHVALTGEAYFEVEKGDGFVVETENGNVQVLGTRFFVGGSNNNLNVKCYEGKVKTEFEESTWILEPGTQFTGNEKTSGKGTFNKATDFPEFARFSKSFSNAPLSKVVGEIESFFNVQVLLDSGKDKNFSGTIETGRLENAVQIVSESLGLKYEFEDEYRIKIF